MKTFVDQDFLARFKINFWSILMGVKICLKIMFQIAYLRA